MANDGGIERLKKRLAAIPKDVRDGVQPVLTKNANELANLMKRLAPEKDGDLIASIDVEQGRHELARAVVAGGERTTRPVRKGADVSYDYAFAQELGTKDMPANPFFYPARRMLDKKIKRSLRSSVSRSVKKHWGKP